MPTSSTNGSDARALLSSLQGIRAASDLLDRHRFVTEVLGKTFDSKRDPHTQLGYKKTLTVSDFFNLYRRGGIAKRVVEAYPNAAWNPAPEIREDPDPDTETEFEAQVLDLAKRLDLWERLRRLDILAQLGKYAVLVIGTDDGDLNQELPRGNDTNQVIWLTVHRQDRADIHRLVTEASDPRFGLPESYSVQFGDIKTGHGKQSVTKLVHWSRVIHYAHGRLENDVSGTPMLQAPWNNFDDLLKIVGGGAEAAWKRADPGLHLNAPLFDKDGKALEFSEQDQNDLEDQAEEYRHNLSRLIQTRGTEVNLLEATVTAFGSNADAVLKLISGTTGIPLRILTGSERGELASSQDRANWNERISEYRRGDCEPLLEDLFGRLIDFGYLATPAQWETVWPDMDHQSETEKAQIAKTLTEANASQVTSEGRIVVTGNEIREMLGLDSLEDVVDDIETANTDDEELRGLEDFDLTDDPAKLPEWKAVHRAADIHRASVASAVRGAWDHASSEMDVIALTDALQRFDAQDADRIINTAMQASNERLMETLPDRLLAVLDDGGLAALRSARARGSFFPAQPIRQAATFEASFETKNPRAERWAERRAAALVTEIAPETMAGVRQIIRQAFREGLPPRVAARQIRDLVGLRSDQVRAVDRVFLELMGKKTGDLVERFPPRKGLRTRAGFRARIPDLSGAERSKWARGQARRYANMQHNLRARTIARTETLRASNQGQRELWLQARDKGQLKPGQRRVWISTPDDRTRDDHLEMQGQVRGIDEPFESPSGDNIEPGEEVNCRCSQGLATPEDISQTERQAA